MSKPDPVPGTGNGRGERSGGWAVSYFSRIPRFLRLLLADRRIVTLTVSAGVGTAIRATYKILGAGHLGLEDSVNLIFIVVAAAIGLSSRASERPWLRASSQFERLARSLTVDKFYLSRDSHVFFFRNVGSPRRTGLQVYRIDENRMHEIGQELEAAQDVIVTADSFATPPPFGWIVLHETHGAAFKDVDGQTVPRDDHPRVSRRAQAVGRWFGLRSGHSIASTEDLVEVCDQIRRAEPFERQAADDD